MRCMYQLVHQEFFVHVGRASFEERFLEKRLEECGCIPLSSRLS